MIQKIACVSVLFFLMSCAHSIHEVHTSDFELPAVTKKNKTNIIELGQVVNSRSEQFVVMGFTQETDYVNQAYANLMNQCMGVAITGITTQLSTSLGFFSWKNKVLMQGMCLNK